MAVVSGAFFDTSVLLAGLIEMGPASEPAQRLMTTVAAGRVRPHTAWHCCLEFYAVSTRLPEEFRLAPADAVRLLEEEILARFQVHQLPGAGWRAFLRAAERDRAAGGRIYDAHIAEIARGARARVVVTDNRRHFTALLRHGIRVATAEEFAAQVRP